MKPKNKADLAASLTNLVLDLKTKHADLERQVEAKLKEFQECQQQIDATRNDQFKLEREIAQLRALAEFIPTQNKITLPCGDFFVASTFRLDPQKVFCLNLVNVILKGFEKEHKGSVVILLNQALLIRIFGSSPRQALDYGGAKFVVSHGVMNDVIIVLAKHYQP